MTAPTGRIHQAASNPQRLALRATRNPRLLPAIIEGLKADKPRVKYGCAKALRLISKQRPDRLYPFFDCFVGLLDHENKIRFASAYDLSVGRNTDELLRVIDACMTGELCPVNWQRGGKTLGK